MSLDVYLTIPGGKFSRAGSGIFVRDGGSTREISREQWDSMRPGVEPIAVQQDGPTEEVYSANITHNLGPMANAAGIYEALWRPDENGITHARQLIEPLSVGLAKLTSDPDGFSVHNPPNGWGSYESLVNFVRDYLAACVTWPDAEVSVWR
jgi:hypothetical protein